MAMAITKIQKLWSSLRRKWSNSPKSSRNKQLQGLKDLMVSPVSPIPDEAETQPLGHESDEAVSDCGPTPSEPPSLLIPVEPEESMPHHDDEPVEDSLERDVTLLANETNFFEDTISDDEGSDIWGNVLDELQADLESNSSSSDIWKACAGLGADDEVEPEHGQGALVSVPVRPEGFDAAATALWADPPSPVDVSFAKHKKSKRDKKNKQAVKGSKGGPKSKQLKKNKLGLMRKASNHKGNKKKGSPVTKGKRKDFSPDFAPILESFEEGYRSIVLELPTELLPVSTTHGKHSYTVFPGLDPYICFSLCRFWANKPVP